MTPFITVSNRKIGAAYPPFIIAEMSGNHNGSFERAKAIVKMVAESGADAIKLQTYTADTMTIRSDKPEFRISDPESLWTGETLYDLYDKAHTPWEWHSELFEYAHELGLIAFSTPFDATAVDFLTGLEVPLFKVASFENTDIPLIRRIAATGKPMIISSGTATLEEVEQAVATARSSGATEIIILKCTSSYPAPHSESNLRTIPVLSAHLGVQIGISDHTLGIGTSIAAVALGATVIEKHVTLSRAEGGVDAAFSLEPQELNALVREAHYAWESLGNAEFAATPKDTASRIFRRSIYVVKPIKKGEAFTPENIRTIRPGYGLPPKEYDRVIQSRASCDLEAGTALAKEHISGI